MYLQCTTERSAALQRKYEQTLLELMQAKSYDAITVNHICTKLGTSRKSFYHYFKSKKGCLCSVIDHMLINYSNFHLSADIELKGYPRMLLTFLAYQKENYQLTELLIQNGLLDVFMERYVSHMKNNTLYTRTCKTEEELAQSEDKLLFYAYGTMAVWRKWHLDGYQRSIYDLAESICRLMPEDELARF